MKLGLLRYLLLTASTATGLSGATFTVININNSGSGSFRQALLDANASPGADQIAFQIPGTGPFTLNPATAFPTITEPVSIDATTQAGYAGNPKVELNGSATPAGSDGLYLLTSNCVVRGLVINRFKRDGIRIESAGGHVVAGNFIGTDLTGTNAAGNVECGITVLTAGNRIGGATPTDRNLISGSNLAGIYLLNGAAMGNLVQGNFIGTDVTGTKRLGNKSHGVIIAGARTNTIGGTTLDSRNIIAGNYGSGIYLTNAHGNLVAGNLIGTEVTGAAALGNAVDGVSLFVSASNRIGGTTTAARNVVSGNGQDGLYLTGSASTGNWVQGNFIGTSGAGTARVPNGNNGILCNEARANLIGGLDPGARNVISGNTWDGVFLFGANASSNVVQGNFIGTSVAGTTSISNGISGIGIENGSANLIGGADAGARNLISGNLANGILLYGSTASSNFIQGNFIGTDTTGTFRIANGLSGIEAELAPNSQIGGSAAGAGNLISGNADTGIYLTSAAGTRIQGNRVGTDATGNQALGNSWAGLEVIDSSGVLLGGTNSGAGNQVSGNGYMGVSIQNAGSKGISVQGNLLGTKADGLSALPNEYHNLAFWGNSSGNLVGGDTPGAGNVIAFANLAAYDGLRVLNGSLNIRIRGNSFFGNGGAAVGSLGIDLGADGPTPNDTCDKDRGANESQNFPVLSSASGGSQTTIQGTLNSLASRAFLLQFYASPACDASAYGEGSLFLGAITVTTDAGCNASFTAVFTNLLPAGSAITATATDNANNTSEFSACVSLSVPPVIADFTGTPTRGSAPLTVVFSNLSSGGTSYLWDFGDGKTSTATSPANTYSTTGTYTVTLTATGPGGTSKLARPNYVTVTEPAPPVVNFTGTPTSGGVPLTVAFNNQTTGATNYHWSFGDGNTSTATSPANTYANTGNYTVTLTAIGPGGTNVLTRANYINVTNLPPPVVNFTGTPTSGGYPMTVTFTNLTTGATSYSWAFGDGKTSTATNPVNTYASSGTYSVTLTATGPSGQSVLTRANYITVTDTRTFTSTNVITIPTSGSAAPYPSTISVSNLIGNATKVTVTLNNFTHAATPDVDVILVGPGGQKTYLMSDAGKGGASGLTLSFDDSASASLKTTSLVSGTFKPTNFDTTTDAFPAPAPVGPYATSLAVFNSLSPNGDWRLFVRDDSNRSGGTIRGWSLSLTVPAPNSENVEPILSNPAISGSDFVLSFATVSGVTYSVQFKNLLTDPEWQTLQTVAGDGTVRTISTPISAAPRRFYRVVAR